MNILMNKSDQNIIELFIIISLAIFVFVLLLVEYYKYSKKEQSIVNAETKIEKTRIVELTVVYTQYVEPRSFLE